ncbi:YIEGIA family protein [Tepidibacillus marianensis]|uniref:YIEGIA family protein n=1 Tax=Tepidibacillus marianensis TaxID=3131995 RepID=UPI0030D13EAA
MVNKEMIAVILGVLIGFLNRIFMLRTDYRQYPTHKHGKLIHLSLGFIAAGLGAVAVPALLQQNYTAITFLGLAAQQFRDVRNTERQTLSRLDELELVPRGLTYIEGIAMVFEGRNYLVIFAAFFTSMVASFSDWKLGILAGIATILVNQKYMSGLNINDIAEVTPSEIRMDGPHLYVDNIYIMNIGLRSTQDLIKKHGMGIIITPKNMNSSVTLANLGQRQAILHNLSTILGVYRDSGEPSLVPLIKRDLNDGRLGVFFVPHVMNMEEAMRVVNLVPVLESAIRLPSESKETGDKK